MSEKGFNLTEQLNKLKSEFVSLSKDSRVKLFFALLAITMTIVPQIYLPHASLEGLKAELRDPAPEETIEAIFTSQERVSAATEELSATETDDASIGGPDPLRIEPTPVHTIDELIDGRIVELGVPRDDKLLTTAVKLEQVSRNGPTITEGNRSELVRILGEDVAQKAIDEYGDNGIQCVELITTMGKLAPEMPSGNSASVIFGELMKAKNTNDKSTYFSDKNEIIPGTVITPIVADKINPRIWEKSVALWFQYGNPGHAFLTKYDAATGKVYVVQANKNGNQSIEVTVFDNIDIFEQEILNMRINENNTLGLQ